MYFNIQMKTKLTNPQSENLKKMDQWAEKC